MCARQLAAGVGTHQSWGGMASTVWYVDCGNQPSITYSAFPLTKHERYFLRGEGQSKPGGHTLEMRLKSVIKLQQRDSLKGVVEMRWAATPIKLQSSSAKKGIFI